MIEQLNAINKEECLAQPKGIVVNLKDLLDLAKAEERFSRLNIVMVGLPGAGKTTLANGFLVKPNYLSLGEITRRELSQNGPWADSLREKFQTTTPWPSEFVMSIITPFILEARAEDRGFILDGVPRKASEARTLVQWLRINGIPIDLLLHLRVGVDVAQKRIASRDQGDRLESSLHYASRINTYLSEEQELLQIMRKEATRSWSIETDGCSPLSVKNQLMRLVMASF